MNFYLFKTNRILRNNNIKVNEEKTKMIRLKKKFTKCSVRLREYVRDAMDKFKYMEVMISSSDGNRWRNQRKNNRSK